MVNIDGLVLNTCNIKRIKDMSCLILTNPVTQIGKGQSFYFSFFAWVSSMLTIISYSCISKCDAFHSKPVIFPQLSSKCDTLNASKEPSRSLVAR